MKLSALALPLLMVPMFLLGGCSSDDDAKVVPAGGTYISASGGASFEQSVGVAENPDITIESYDLGRIRRLPQDPTNIVIAAGSNGMVVSHNDGASWQVIEIPSLIATIDALQLPNGILLASGVNTIGQGMVVRSLDNGTSWQNVFTIPRADKKPGLQIIKGPDAPPAAVVALELDPRQPGVIWAGTNEGTLLQAQQDAKIWRKTAELSTPTQSVTGDRTGAGIVRLIASPITPGELTIVTKDKRLLTVTGATVKEIKVPESNNLPQSFGVSFGSRNIVNALLVPGFPNALLIGATDGVLVTRDKGQSYLPVQLPIDASKIFSTIALAVSPKNANRILIAIDGIVYRSEDSGTTWNTTDLPAGQSQVGANNVRITDISINPANPAKVLVVAKPIES